MPLAEEMREVEMAEVITVDLKVLAAHAAALVVVLAASVAVALVDSDEDVLWEWKKQKRSGHAPFFCLYKVEAAAYLVLQT